MAPRKVNKTTPKPGFLQTQRMKLKATKLEAPPATTSGPTYGPGAGRTGMAPQSSNMMTMFRDMLGIGSGMVGTAAAVMRPRPLADGTMDAAIKRGDVKPPPAPKLPPPTPRKTQLSSAAQDFDRSFARARAAGLDEFTWRGRRYNTRYAGE